MLKPTWPATETTWNAELIIVANTRVHALKKMLEIFGCNAYTKTTPFNAHSEESSLARSLKFCLQSLSLSISSECSGETAPLVLVNAISTKLHVLAH